MKSQQLKLTTIFALLLLFSGTTVFGQQKDTDKVKKEEKKIIIVKKSVDEDGNITVKKIVKEGADAENLEIIEIEDGEGHMIFEKEGNVEWGSDVMDEQFHHINVEVDDNNGENHIKIIMKKDGDGEPEIIEWRGEGEMQEELRNELKEKNIFIHEADGEGHDIMKFKSIDMDNGNKACLGVMIGKTKEVKNINGEETVTSEGETEEGVAILDIIDDSGAQEAGLLKDDIITAINGTTVSSIEDVLSLLNSSEPGQSVTVAYLRNDQAAQVNATLKACATKSVNKTIWINDDGNEFELDGDNDWEFEDEDGNVIEKKKRIIIIKEGEEDGEETAEEFIFEPVELGENSLDLQEIDLYPNPTKGNLNVSFRAPAVPTTVQIVDITGKEVYNSEILDFNGSFQKEISLSNAAKGTLLLSIRQGDKVFTEKVVLQ